MKLGLPRRSHRDHPRGQGLVEFAILLPLLALLLVMAIDFGRVFFGWVALHNAVRIGADYAAAHADYWDGMPGPLADERQRYEDLVLNDLQALNCTLPSGGPEDPIPEPQFSGFNDGDLVMAEITCSFGLITPLAEAVLGGPVDMMVRTEFAVNYTIVAGIPGGGAPGGPPPPPPPGCEAGELLVPDLTDMTVGEARTAWEATAFAGAFTPASGSNGQQVDTQDPPEDTCQPVSSSMEVFY